MATTTKAGRTLREELNNVIMLHHPDHYIGFDRQGDVSLLMRRARRYARMQEDACNYAWASGDKWDAQKKRLEQSILSLAMSLPGIKGVTFGGDPRGYTVKLLLECGRGNTWGGDAEGWGIA